MLIRNILFVMLSCLVVACQQGERTPYQKSNEEVLQVLNHKEVLFGESLEQFISEHDGQYLLVDLREAADFKVSHPKGAVDIPMPQLLKSEHQELLNSKEYILLSGDSYTQTAGAQVLLNRLGYENVHIVSFSATTPPESARYDYAAVFNRVQKQHAHELEAGKPKPVIVPATPKKTIAPKPKPQKKAVVEEEEGC